VRDAVIVDAARTPIGKRNGALAGWHPTDLLGHVLRELVTRNDLDPAQIDDVIGGCVTQSGEQGTNVTRNAWLAAGLDPTVPATTVDRQCGSSQQAVHFAAQGVMAGAYDIAIACGVESMTRAPMASNSKGGTGPFSPAFLEHVGGLKLQFEVAQKIADDWAITRDDMDEFAVESHRRAHAATEAGAFEREIIPVPLRDADGNPTGEVMSRDEGIRPDANKEVMSGLPSAMKWKPELAKDITAGNSSQMNDGAAAMLITTPEIAERNGLTPRARFTHFSVGADSGLWVLTAPNPVTRKAFAKTGHTATDFDAIEVNEAFASISLAWAREFGPDMKTFNPRGGGISLGHPLGASGVRLMTTMLHFLEDTGGRLGFQTMCEGGGQANATIIERL
jgi:acetyl-CoA acetyltransferase family protein